MSKIPLIIPAASLEWEVWRWRRGSTAMERTVADPALMGEEQIGVGLSAGELLLLSLWLTTRDATLFEGMILSQLEKRGLVSRNASGAAPVFDYFVIAEEEGRTLVRVALLPVNFPGNLALHQAACYASAADLLPLPENQLTLWMERQHMVATFSYGEEAVYQQVISRGAALASGVAAELTSIRLALEAEGVIKRLAGVTVWHSPDQPIDGVECLAALGLPVEEAERPAPSGPRLERASARARLVPPKVLAYRKARTQRERLRRYSLVALAIYIGSVFLLWTYQFQLKRQAATLGALVKADEPAAKTLEQTAGAWRTLESAVEPRYYALEQFHQAVSVLPAVGIRFSSFELKDGVITIRGIARNAPEVFSYAEALRQHRELPSYHWQVGQPRVLKDDTAEFKIEGRRR